MFCIYFYSFLVLHLEHKVNNISNCRHDIDCGAGCVRR